MAGRRKVAEELMAAHRESISFIKDLLDDFRELRGEMESYETKKNAAKTVGTTIGAAGAAAGLAGIGLAFFTGGVSLALTAGSIAGAVGGAGVNLITDIVDHIESKGFFKRIDGHGQRYNKQLEQLASMWREIDQLVKQLMEEHKIDADTALYVLFNTTTACSQALGLISSTTNATMMLQAAQIIKTLKSFGTLIKTPTSGLQFIMRTTELTAKQSRALANIVGSDAIRFAPSVGKPLLQGTLAVVAVVVSLWEIKTLIDDWTGTHPTIQAVDKVTGELRKKKQSLEERVGDIRALISHQH